MSISARCDLNSKDTILKLHDMCTNPKYKCKEQTTSTPNQFQLQGAGFKSKLGKKFNGTQSAWIVFLEPAVNLAPPFIGIAVVPETKKPQADQPTTETLKSLLGGKVLNLMDMQGHRLRLKDM